MTPRPAYSWKYYQRVVRVRRLFGRFRQLIAPGQDAADRFVRDGFPRDRVTVLPYFCRIAPLAVPRPVPEKPMILYLGRLSSNKGWQNFVRALGMLPEPVQGQIVGNVDAAAERELQQLTRETGTGERLTWRRWATQEEISELLQQTSVLVFPSLWPETLGIVGLEAMAHGVPVVASDIGGVPDWLREGETGYRVEPGDVSGLADRIQRIVSSTELAQRLGRQSLADLNARFLPETHLATLQQIYRNAVAD